MEKSMVKPASLFAALGKGFTLNGVTAVVSSGASEAVLKTESGVIRLRGENFNVTKVDLEAGIVEMQGSLTGFLVGKVKAPLIKRIFK